MMPVMDGFEFLEKIRKVDRWSDIPTVVLTAKNLSDRERSFLAERTLLVLSKSGQPIRSLGAALSALARRGHAGQAASQGVVELPVKILLVEDNEMRSRHAVAAVDPQRLRGRDGGRRPAGGRHGRVGKSGDHPDGHEPAGDRRLGGDASGQSQSGHAEDSIIALTAHAMAEDETKARGAGCDDFDTKPVDIARLVGKINALLNGKAG